MDGSQSDAPARRLDASAGGVGSSEQRVPMASAGSNRIDEDATDDGDLTDEEGQTETEYSDKQRKAACRAIVRKVSRRIQKVIVQRCVQGETEEVSVLSAWSGRRGGGLGRR